MTFFNIIKAFFTIPRNSIYCYRATKVTYNSNRKPRIHTKQCGFYSPCHNGDDLCGNCGFLGTEITDMVKDCGIRDDLRQEEISG